MENYDYKLFDNADKHQYEFRIDNMTPRIEYIKNSTGEIYLTHTQVPLKLEGKGIGSLLIQKVLEDIGSRNLRLVPLCPFVAGYIQKHPEWRRIVMRGFSV